jgi:small subunit ribosomal protein S8
MSTVTDPIADLLARVRNGARAQKMEVFVPYSKLKAEVVRILKNEGYISEYEVDTKVAHPRIKITNKLVDHTCAITGLKRVSRPGLRRYVGADEIPRVLGGMGTAILSTAAGLRLVILCRELEINRLIFLTKSKSTSTLTAAFRLKDRKESSAGSCRARLKAA